MLHSSAARRVWCRAGRSLGPAPSTGRRRSSRSSRSAGGRVHAWPAASSIASGSPSSRRHTARSESSSPSPVPNPASSACARATISARASSSGSGWDRIHVLARQVEDGSAGDDKPEPRRRRQQPHERWPGREQVLEAVQHEEDLARLQPVRERLHQGLPGPLGDGEAVQQGGTASAWSRSGDRSEEHRPVREQVRRGARERQRRRDFPLPPAPFRVTRRTSSRWTSAVSSSSSRARPMSGFGGAGNDAARGGSGGRSAGSWRRIARSTPRSSLPGSSPSSSWSACRPSPR